PRAVSRQPGPPGPVSWPRPKGLGGGAQRYGVYLQVVEEIAYAWMSVAVGVSVHSRTCFPLATFGTPEQQERYLHGMLSGDQLGAYCLSEPQAGSDVASIRTRAVPAGGEAGDGGGPTAYRISGTKAWISHAGHADFYTSFVRTSDDGSRGLSCFLVPAGAAGLGFAEPEKKMGLDCDTVGEVLFDGVEVAADRLIGRPGQGMQIA